MSRPALPKKALRSDRVYLRLTPGELQQVERAAKKAGKFTTSEWLREIVKKEIERACVG